VVHDWNSLPQFVDRSVNHLKNRLDKHWNDMSILTDTATCQLIAIQIQVNRPTSIISTNHNLINFSVRLLQYIHFPSNCTRKPSILRFTLPVHGGFAWLATLPDAVAYPGFGERGGAVRGSGGRKSPSGVQGQSPWWGFGGKAPKRWAILGNLRVKFCVSNDI
jgi:hypothetical protein